MSVKFEFPQSIQKVSYNYSSSTQPFFIDIADCDYIAGINSTLVNYYNKFINFMPKISEFQYSQMPTTKTSVVEDRLK